MAKLHFYYSAMNAGKSTALLQANHNYGERGMQTLLLTAALDDRAGRGVIKSRIGIETQAVAFEKADNLAEIVRTKAQGQSIGCVLIDEAQFLTRKQVNELTDLVDHDGIPVLAYGLRTDFREKLLRAASTCWLGLMIFVKLRQFAVVAKRPR